MSAKINVINELERIQHKFEWADNDEIKCICPFHDDKSPSCYINIAKTVFSCRASTCNASGDFIAFLAKILKQPRGLIIEELSTRYTLADTKVIEAQVVERFHKEIWKAHALRNELYVRGLDDDDIREARLGVNENRITIPIDNESGLWVNIRKYLPGAPGNKKMQNTKGYGEPRLYPISQLRYPEIMICGGEIKARAAMKQLNKYNIGAICVTAGEGAWLPQFNAKVAGKRLHICLDVDEGGRLGAERVCGMVYGVAAEVTNIVLPLDVDKYPKGDINDFIYHEKGQLKPLIDAAELWEPSASLLLRYDENEPPEAVSLTKACHADMAGKRIKIQAMATAIADAPYVIPSSVAVLCEKNQNCCSICPVNLQPGKEEFAISSESPAVLEMVNANLQTQHIAIMRGVGVPLQCKQCAFTPLSFYNVEDVRISPTLDISNRSNERVMQPAVCVGDGMELNESYELIGRMFPHPKTQQSTLVISKYKATQDALSSYKNHNSEELKIFQPKTSTLESLTEKLNHIYDDLEANVTRILQRRDMHLIVDMTMHSVLHFRFNGKETKGWVESLIVGDSGQGKSDTIQGMMQHYGLGAKVECKNASVAGLLGGLQHLGTRWFVTWGILPTNDKRFVFLEELKGAAIEVIGKLTDMRTTGVAEIPKIERRRTPARTRICAASNPRSERPCRTYNHGVEIIRELIGNPEDVRRFDVFAVLDSRDVDVDAVSKQIPKQPHTYTKELCKRLVLWCWTRTADDVVIEDDATQEIIGQATIFCNTFSDAIPIVDKGSMRLKLARLAIAVAGRTFSTDDQYEKLIVKKEHVLYVAQTLMRIYSGETFGYLEFTASQRLSDTLVDEESIKHKIESLPFPLEFCKHIARAPVLDVFDLCDFNSWDKEQANDLLSFLVRKHALKRIGRNYVKTAPFIQFVKWLMEGDNLKNRPNYVEEMNKLKGEF